jgi:hypothetical protein
MMAQSHFKADLKAAEGAAVTLVALWLSCVVQPLKTASRAEGDRTDRVHYSQHTLSSARLGFFPPPRLKEGVVAERNWLRYRS